MGNSSSTSSVSPCLPCKASRCKTSWTENNENDNTGLKFTEGDVIEIHRKKSDGRSSYSHYAVYEGGNMIIHVQPFDDPIDSCQCSDKVKFAPDNTNPKCNRCNKYFKACVRRDALDKICENDKCRLDHSFDRDQRPKLPTEIVERARSMLGPIEYNRFTHNCEHFATWCRYGIPRCCQSSIKWEPEIEYIKKVKGGECAAPFVPITCSRTKPLKELHLPLVNKDL